MNIKFSVFLLDLIKIESQIPFTTEKAIRDFSIDLSQSFAIGDKPRDCAICEVKECQVKTDFLDAAREITGK